jgi:hypothetical protein
MKTLLLASLILLAWEIPNFNDPEIYPGIPKGKSSYDLSGTYEYIYPYNSEDLIENQYIILIKSKEGYSGWYYGTSDEFDSAREGYLPAFFVTEMLNLKISNDTITFKLAISDNDLLTEPVTLKLRSTEEAIKDGYSKWSNMINPTPKEYWGLIINSNQISLKGADEFQNKAFNKKK